MSVPYVPAAGDPASVVRRGAGRGPASVASRRAIAGSADDVAPCASRRAGGARLVPAPAFRVGDP
ncbi:MAG TPA: hypothetical protein DGC76_03700 [Candidatus Accumulibacter sp.]|nr:hypothetical protein [Accumulibacter sp.]